MKQDTPNPAADPAPRRWKNITGFCVGAFLLGAAVWVAWRGRAELSTALGHAREARWWQVALLLMLPWLSCSLNSFMYAFLMNRDARRGTRQHVGLVEMHAVLASAWLMNYLWARPGMFGRLAYHKTVNDIPLRESIGASLVAMACGVAGMAMLAVVAVGLTVLADRAGHPPTVLHTVGALLLPALACLACAVVFRGREVWRRVCTALCCRYVDVLSWLARYLVLLAVLGRDVTVVQAAAFTVVSQVVAMVPFVGNGLGLREWANALLGPSLPAWMRGAGGAVPSQLSLSMELLHRAAEVLAALPAGLAGGYLVARRVRALSREGAGGEPAPSVVHRG
ncbi:MAG: hypothetical protein U0637_08645 [Phycisphaerales bacterium]